MNRMQRNGRILVLLLIAFWLSSCSQKSSQQETIEPDAIIEQSKQSPVVDEHEYLSGIDALSIKDYAAAKKFFTRFADKYPGLSGAYLNLAFIAFRQKEYEEANRLTSRVLRLNPEHAQAHHLRALLHQHNGRIRRAEKDFKKAIELKPGYAIAHYNLALLYDIFLQELVLAIEHYSIYLELLDREDEETQNWIKHLKNTLANG